MQIGGGRRVCVAGNCGRGDRVWYCLVDVCGGGKGTRRKGEGKESEGE